MHLLLVSELPAGCNLLPMLLLLYHMLCNLSPRLLLL